MESRLRHHQSIALLGLVHLGRQIDLESSLSVIPVTWKLNGLNRMNQGFTALPDGTRELRRVRFSRERFGEMHARMWWDENRARIQEQYL
ncbi:hypothetical protein V6N13_119782 [Hibiscus sabdariffa]|uniref:BRX domain-containing protein n=1 Tax=Hibiscus sabdariffa TaxID=183260 RepID=A0ABR2E2B6_9ROSI